MLIHFTKYHALQNDFLVVESNKNRVGKSKLSELAKTLCHRRAGVGGDGLLFLYGKKGVDRQIDLYNSDGSWAEKSGNGLRIVALHEYLSRQKKRSYRFAMGGEVHQVGIGKKEGRAFLVNAELGHPEFGTGRIPVKTKQKYLINAPLKIGKLDFPVTCLSVGNPHTVLFVADFDFDWKSLGAEIEHHPAFPNQTNVEFVRIVSRSKVEVADWERGAGATGSSGTGAAAAVCAGVMNGQLNRRCDVVFQTGTLKILWNSDTDQIELTGPVEKVTEGVFQFA